jgi:hypothetical protein
MPPDTVLNALRANEHFRELHGAADRYRGARSRSRPRGPVGRLRPALAALGRARPYSLRSLREGFLSRRGPLFQAPRPDKESP